MGEYWRKELIGALHERGVDFSNLSPMDAANEYMIWKYGAPLATEAIKVYAEAKKMRAEQTGTES